MQSMTPSTTETKVTTAGQIDKAVANYRALLEKHSGEFNTEAVQMVIGQPELTREQLEVFRRRVEALSNLIVRIAKVNRSRSPQEALDATGRVQYTNRKVVDNMPKASADKVEIVFFKLDLSKRNGFISDDDLEKEFELRGLKPADPISVAAVNEDDPAFADKKPNGTHWKDDYGNWYHIVFHRYYCEREVAVYRSDDEGWEDHIWFAGVRK